MGFEWCLPMHIQEAVLHHDRFGNHIRILECDAFLESLVVDAMERLSKQLMVSLDHSSANATGGFELKLHLVQICPNSRRMAANSTLVVANKTFHWCPPAAPNTINEGQHVSGIT